MKKKLFIYSDNMKRTRKYIEFGVNSKHKEQTTISTIMYYPHKKQKDCIVIRY